jgi:hypothetical protein
MTNCEAIGRAKFKTLSRYFHEMRKSTRNLRHYSRCLDPDSKQTPQEYMSEAMAFEPTSTMTDWLLNFCWPSPAQWLLVPSPTGLATIFYCLTNLGAFRQLTFPRSVAWIAPGPRQLSHSWFRVPQNSRSYFSVSRLCESWNWLSSLPRWSSCK